MSFDLQREYYASQERDRMFLNIMIGVSKKFFWPGVQLLSVERVERFNDRTVMKIQFNVFKTTVFEVDVTELIYNSRGLAPVDKYELVGQQAGFLLQRNCDGYVPSNVELGEN